MTTRQLHGARGRHRRLATAVCILGVAAAMTGAAACANTSATTSDAGATTRTTTTAGAGAPATGAATGRAARWQKVVAPNPCLCSDGSGFNFFVHRGDPAKVLFYLEGGGACFSAATCGPADPTYTRNLSLRGDPSKGVTAGIFNFSNPANPFADYSVVFVPYCTGDVHLGNAVHDYGGGVVVHHNGYINASTALSATAATFPGAATVVVAGGSAGSAGSPLYAGLAHDAFPAARVTVIADGSGAYPATPAITAAIGALWGTSNAIPSWPETAGLAAQEWTLPGLFVHAAKHDPDLTVAMINSAYDTTQTDFVKKVGLPADDLVSMIDGNVASIESKGVPVHSLVAPGTLHTILGRPEFYTKKVGSTAIRDWVADLVAGKDAPDVHCTDCHAPT